MGAANDNLFPRFCTILGLERLVGDARFAGVGLRLKNRAELETLIEAVTARQPRAHWLERCEAAGVPAGPINSVPEALADAHVRARGMVQELNHPQAGRVNALGNPVKMSLTPPVMTAAAPTLGQHTGDVLRELGYADGEIATLRAQQVVV